jgi:hypothetical protein
MGYDRVDSERLRSIGTVIFNHGYQFDQKIGISMLEESDLRVYCRTGIVPNRLIAPLLNHLNS